MSEEIKCPFCLKKFDRREQLTYHLIYDSCKQVVKAEEADGTDANYHSQPFNLDETPSPERSRLIRRRLKQALSEDQQNPPT